jgi:phage replication-related protein YjqB (UPF0714/DUF867 family)
VLDELLAQPGVVEDLRLGSTFGIMAFHGGSLEKMTDVIAREVADRSGASLYALRQPHHLRWHVPSRLVDPAHSEALAAFLDHVDVAIAVHGYGRPGRHRTILMGGSNRTLARRLAAATRQRIDHYEVVDDLVAIPAELRGLHPDNPVNRARRGGVQVELPPRARGLGPFWNGPGDAGDRVALSPHTTSIIEAWTDVATQWTPGL